LDKTPDEIRARLLKVFSERFEIDNPNPDEDLREAYDFDSIDAIDLLREIELMLETKLTIEQKKSAMSIRTINDVVDYVSSLV
jgi:acyl carrier protein